MRTHQAASINCPPLWASSGRHAATLTYMIHEIDCRRTAIRFLIVKENVFFLLVLADNNGDESYRPVMTPAEMIAWSKNI
ncbi:hypothetical protein BS78_01G162400 [Paspalum vaginatum]|nr:hypothetical protein BS78_01G162400 [Paspalum vaginatum]